MQHGAVDCFAECRERNPAKVKMAALFYHHLHIIAFYPKRDASAAERGQHKTLTFRRSRTFVKIHTCTFCHISPGFVIRCITDKFPNCHITGFLFSFFVFYFCIGIRQFCNLKPAVRNLIALLCQFRIRKDTKICLRNRPCIKCRFLIDLSICCCICMQ